MTNPAPVDNNQAHARVSMIAALGRNRELGSNNELLWHISEDLAHFKKLTDGHAVVMGRKTWESLPEKFRPLPGRTNIVVTRNAAYEAAGATIASSLDAALLEAARAPGADEIFVIGGGELYREALPRATRLYLTLVDEEVAADVFFPEYEKEFTKVIESIPHNSHTHAFSWVTLER